MPNKIRLQHIDFLWGIRPEAIDTLDSVMAAVGPEKVSEYMAAAGSRTDQDAGYQLRDGVAVIPITGTITKGRSFWSFLYGGGNLQRLTLAVNNALVDPKVSAILLDIDSPGGTVSGTEAFGDLVYSARQIKPVVAFGNGMVASAAYWIGSGANTVIVEKTADVGSIGVLYVHWDTSKEDEMFGWKRTLITAGEFKGVGNDMAPLSQRDRDIIQAELDTIYTIFIETVARNRNVSAETVRSDMADGRIFIGQQAVDAGLADRVGAFQDALSTARELATTNARNQFNAGGITPEKEASMPENENTTVEAPKSVADLQARYPELSAELVQQGRDSVDVQAVQQEATTAETTRMLGFVNAYFGEEAGTKFKAVIDTGVSIDQFKAIAGDKAPGNAAGAGAISAVKEELLAAIQEAGADNPGSGGGDNDDKDFMTLVEETATARKISKTAAMQQVAKSHPKLHQAYVKKANWHGES